MLIGFYHHRRCSAFILHYSSDHRHSKEQCSKLEVFQSMLQKSPLNPKTPGLLNPNNPLTKQKRVKLFEQEANSTFPKYTCLSVRTHIQRYAAPPPGAIPFRSASELPRFGQLAVVLEFEPQVMDRNHVRPLSGTGRAGAPTSTVCERIRAGIEHRSYRWLSCLPGWW